MPDETEKKIPALPPGMDPRQGRTLGTAKEAEQADLDLRRQVTELLNGFLLHLHHRFDRLEARFDRIDDRLDRIESRLDRIESQLELMKASFRPA